MIIEERYTRATHSSSLRTQDRPGDVDTLIAAGWIKEGMGTMLWRLRAEYDLVLRDVARAHHDDLTAMLLALMQVKSLGPTKDALGRLMIIEATRQKFMQPDSVVLVLASHVLRAYIHPQCYNCGGRGTVGNLGSIQVCKPCGGTGRRVATIGRDDHERHFTAHVLTILDRKSEVVARAMQKHLRTTAKRVTIAASRRFDAGPRAHDPQSDPPAVPVDSGQDPDRD